MIDLVKMYFRPYRKVLFLIAVLSIVQAVLQIVLIDTIKPLVTYSIKTIDTGSMIKYGSVMFLSVIGFSVVAFIIVRLSVKVSSETVGKLREDLFAKVISLKEDPDSGIGVSGLMTRLVSDVDMVQRFIIDFLCIGIYVPILMIIILIKFGFTNIWFFMMLMLALVAAYVFIRLMTQDELRVRERIQSMVDRTISTFRGLVCGIRTARAYDRERGLYDEFSKENKAYGAFATDTSVRMSFISTFAILIFCTVVVAVLIVAGCMPTAIEASVGDLLLAVQFSMLLVSCSPIIPFLIETVPGMQVSYRRISDVMNSESENIGDGIPDHTDEIIRCSNGLTLRSGSDVALVGCVGAGKSEVIRELLRLDEAEKGTIFFEGRDITELDPDELRKRIAYAGPIAQAFRGKLRDNIDVWRGNSDERLECIKEAVMLDLPLDFQVQKYGSNTSQGQIQKISIARALAKDADVYIFDDCFTNLDPKTQIEIIGNIRVLLKGKTILFSSTDHHAAEGADTVSVMDGGKIIATGTHEEMLDSCSIYSDIYSFGRGIQ